MKLFCIVICIVYLVNSATLNNVNLLKILKSFVKKFRAPNPLPIYYDTSIETKLKLMKAASSEFNLSLKWITYHPCNEKFLLFITKTDFWDDNYKINLNQEIYFLMKDTFEIYEQYNVNNHDIIKQNQNL